MLPTFLISMTLLSLVSVANAATFYVDNNNRCPGIGSSASPYCSITIATTNRQCGDVVKIRTGKHSYRETIVINEPSCPASAPIVVRADDGHHPLLTSRTGPSVEALFHLVDVSNWRVEGLIFDGKLAGGDGTETPQYAFKAQARNVDVTGIVFSHNQVRNWALYKDASLELGRAIGFEGGQGSKHFVYNSLITGNIIENVRGIGINIRHARNSTISKNDISNLLCKMQGPDFANVIAIKEQNTQSGPDDPTSDTMDNVFEENVIHDLPDWVTCAIESGIADPSSTNASSGVFGYWCDNGAKRGIVRWNTIYNINNVTEPMDDSPGILIESRCHGYTVEGNVISKIGGSGIAIRNANDVQILHNTIYDIQKHGVNLKDGARTVIMDNIFSKNQGSSVHISSLAQQDGGHIIDYNLYDLTVGHPGSFGGATTPETFLEWKQLCQCEAHGRTGDVFVDPENGDFTLNTWSAAINGSSTGTDMGAFDYWY